MYRAAVEIEAADEKVAAVEMEAAVDMEAADKAGVDKVVKDRPDRVVVDADGWVQVGRFSSTLT